MLEITLWKGRSSRPEIVYKRQPIFRKIGLKQEHQPPSFIVIGPDFATKWFPPGENIFKCNIDASWDLASGIIVSMLVQDSHGSFIRGCSSRLGRQ